MTAQDFSRRQLELTAEFGKYVFDHPDLDERLPEDAFVFFEVDGEPEFNQHSRELAEMQQRAGNAVVRVHVKGLAPPQGSRLIEPVIDTSSVVG